VNRLITKGKELGKEDKKVFSKTHCWGFHIWERRKRGENKRTQHKRKKKKGSQAAGWSFCSPRIRVQRYEGRAVRGSYKYGKAQVSERKGRTPKARGRVSVGPEKNRERGKKKKRLEVRVTVRRGG